MIKLVYYMDIYLCRKRESKIFRNEPPAAIGIARCFVSYNHNRFRIEGAVMKGVIEERAVTLAKYIVDKKTTVRDAAKYFNISKSTVHKDVSERLKRINPQLYNTTKSVLAVNKAERHLRGGQATKNKYRLDAV